MRWDLIQMRWPQYRTMAKRRWLALTDAQLDAVCGLKDLLVQSLQTSYGVSRDVAEREIESWTSTFEVDAFGLSEDDLEAGGGTLPAASLQHALEQRRRNVPRR